jgi:hypothetical protein
VDILIKRDFLVPIHTYKIIQDFNHTKDSMIYVSTSIFERLFIPKYWGKKNKLVSKKTPNPDFLIDHKNKLIICHPFYMTKLNFYLQKTGDRDDFPWFHRQ